MADDQLVSGMEVDGEEKAQEGAAFGDTPSRSPRTRTQTGLQTVRSTRDFADYATSFTLGLMTTDRQRDGGEAFFYDERI